MNELKLQLDIDCLNFLDKELRYLNKTRNELIETKIRLSQDERYYFYSKISDFIESKIKEARIDEQNKIIKMIEDMKVENKNKPYPAHQNTKNRALTELLDRLKGLEK